MHLFYLRNWLRPNMAVDKRSEIEHFPLCKSLIEIFQRRSSYSIGFYLTVFLILGLQYEASYKKCVIMTPFPCPLSKWV